VAFLSGNGLALMWNNDGFQPAVGRNYSVEAIYAVLMNLPRDIRYREENMILVALIPGGLDVKMKVLNAFLRPVVDELVKLWESPELTRLQRRVAVLCFACDMPASHALGGFSSHGALVGGTRTLWRWQAKGEGLRKRACFGKRSQPYEDPFDDRTRDAWLEAGKEWRDATTQKRRNEIKKETGVRWSELMRLAYAAPFMFTVDGMHNVWEGLTVDLLHQILDQQSSKLPAWGGDAEGKTPGVHSDADDEQSEGDRPGGVAPEKAQMKKVLRRWEADLRRIRFPRSVGPIAGKVGHKLSKLKGAELKNMLNSCLEWMAEGVVPDPAYQLLVILARVSRVACQRTLLIGDIEAMHADAVLYCSKYEDDQVGQVQHLRYSAGHTRSVSFG
jgi:hypothetical protein